jgi:hypothetical protein
MRYAWIVLVVVACKSSSREGQQVRVTSKTDLVSGSGDVVQPRFSGGAAAPTDEGRLGFTITKVHAHRKAAVAAPFHEAGGDWTYVEAHVDGDPSATFVVGMPAFARTDGGMPGFGKIMIAPTTSEAGARVITHLAKALATKAPAAKPGGVLQAIKVPVAVLGSGIGKLDNGYGGKGTWDATKLFCSAGEIDAAELFFNISLSTKQGEFSEKDTDYNEDVVACLAIVLRDGSAPPRTPANDPTLSATGPRLEIGKKIGNRRMFELALTPARLLMVEERGTNAAVVEIDVKTGTTNDRFKTDDRIETGTCEESQARCVLKLSKPAGSRNAFGGDDISSLVILDGNEATPLDQSAFGVRPELVGGKSLSPDARYVIATVRDSDATRVIALDRKTEQTSQLSGADQSYIEVVEWVKEAGKWVAIVTRSSLDEDKPDVLEWHVENKGASKSSKRPAPARISPRSPDGKRSAQFTRDGKLTVTVDGKPRTLVFHAADARHVRPGCCAWVDNRFIAMESGFIDTDAMKVSLLPVDPDTDAPRVTFVQGTRTAIVFRDDGAYLANLVGP